MTSARTSSRRSLISLRVTDEVELERKVADRCGGVSVFLDIAQEEEEKEKKCSRRASNLERSS